MTTATEQHDVIRPRSSRPLAAAFGRFRRHHLGMLGVVILSAAMLGAIFAPWLAPYDPSAIDYLSILVPPTDTYVLGTDEIGRDLLSRLLYGARVSLTIVAGAILIALVAGSVIGLIAGVVGGKVDDIIMRIMDGLLAFPMLIFALGIVAVLGPNLFNAIIAIGLVNTPEFARLVRGQTLSVREQEFVLAAHALGASTPRIMFRHIWPSVAGNVVVYAALRACSALITESSLAFLGLGVSPPTPTWGQMLATALQFPEAWWLGVFPGLAIFLTALSFNFIGDGIRDAIDVRVDT
ncbi:ABC transporter permease [Shinella sp.]|uniref:ABC transporter permease n=1 Tax=Shinella sp. TaxID=1870904 RepID=UPI003F6EF45D